MEKLMRANFLSTSFNFTSRKRQKYRERKRGNKNSLSPPSQESHFLENSHGENPLISISLNQEKFHHPRPFHATRSYLEEGKKKKKKRPRRCYIKLLQAEKPLSTRTRIGEERSAFRASLSPLHWLLGT